MKNSVPTWTTLPPRDRVAEVVVHVSTPERVKQEQDGAEQGHADQKGDPLAREAERIHAASSWSRIVLRPYTLA
jgi:hypothetical protein